MQVQVQWSKTQAPTYLTCRLKARRTARRDREDKQERWKPPRKCTVIDTDARIRVIIGTSVRAKIAATTATQTVIIVIVMVALANNSEGRAIIIGQQRQ